MELDYPHRRLNLLNRQWVLVSPHRAKRPWQGQVEKNQSENLPAYDPACYLCPGNERNTGIKNPDYSNTYVFDNDFSALLPPDSTISVNKPGLNHDLFNIISESGICRVVCFSPRHDLSLPEFSPKDVELVINTWIEQTNILSQKDFIQYVQIFENKGALMGCSNPHPHSQIWATKHVPNEPAAEDIQQETYLEQNDKCLLCDYIKAEIDQNERIVARNDSFVALVPFWAVWPFEILLVSTKHIGTLSDLLSEEISALAKIIQQITTLYDNLFEISFPYSMGFHQTPYNSKIHPGWHLHAHYYPPLLRSATVRKFMVGFEMLGMPQRDLTPETAAQQLRKLNPIHYKLRKK